VSWDFAMELIAKLMKEDRDANWIEKNPRRRDRQPVLTTAIPRRQFGRQRRRMGDVQGFAWPRAPSDR